MNKSALGAFIFLSLLALLGSLGLRPKDYDASNDVRLDLFPEEIAGWSSVELPAMGPRYLQILKLDRYVRRIYSHQEHGKVIVYIGYWKHQTGEHQAAKHSPSICLPANGWNIFAPSVKEVSLPTESRKNASFEINELLAEFNEETQLFYYWFFIGENSYREEWQSLLKLSWHSLLRRRMDGGIVEFSTIVSRSRSETPNVKKGQKTLDAFMKDVYPKLHSILHKEETDKPELALNGS